MNHQEVDQKFEKFRQLLPGKMVPVNMQDFYSAYEQFINTEDDKDDLRILLREFKDKNLKAI